MTSSLRLSTLEAENAALRLDNEALRRENCIMRKSLNEIFADAREQDALDQAPRFSCIPRRRTGAVVVAFPTVRKFVPGNPSAGVRL